MIWGWPIFFEDRLPYGRGSVFIDRLPYMIAAQADSLTVRISGRFVRRWGSQRGCCRPFCQPSSGTPLCAASVLGHVELKDSNIASVRKGRDYSGVVVWLLPAAVR
jgi:hypothetical protein